MKVTSGLDRLHAAKWRPERVAYDAGRSGNDKENETMNRTSMRALLCAAAAMLCFGCATPPNAPPAPAEADLLAAGFSVHVATTPQQVDAVQSLTPGTISAVQRTGVHFYVYPDPANRRVYVGTPQAYLSYAKLHPASAPTPLQQHEADMASYLKQDAGMQLNNARDLNDPYYFWNSFLGGGFR
jgi:hypothetical protein